MNFARTEEKLVPSDGKSGGIMDMAMNKYEERARVQRKATLRSSMSIWTAALALFVVTLLILGLRGSASPDFFYKAGLGVAIVLLILRQVMRRLKTKGPRAARPDPKSTLKLS
jgi:hypothetical protein